MTIAFQGDYGKPRPALVIQGDAFLEHTSVTVLLLTSYLVDAPLLRPTIKSSEDNHLSKESQRLCQNSKLCLSIDLKDDRTSAQIPEIWN